MYPNIPAYYRITPEELSANARIPVTVMEDAGEVLSNYAFHMLLEIEQNNREGRKTVFILPCGPTAQYPIFARLSIAEGQACETSGLSTWTSCLPPGESGYPRTIPSPSTGR